jgi:MinD-like ATPase involved in chromosome partitioning or flagellar assembly
MGPLTVSFVSGKGGVGKTSLAANFAWVCSRISKTVLIDLDFQNQGCTGLFLRSVSGDDSGAFEFLMGTADFASCKPAFVDENLHFVPAVSIAHPPQYSSMPGLLKNADLASRLCEFILLLRKQYLFEVVVLDCHGGLDYASVAAYEASQSTIVVTEADPVTFNGTLELLSFYDSTVGVSASSPATAEVLSATRGGDSGAPKPHEANGWRKIEFIVNRLPPKYQFSDVQGTYRRLLSRYSGRLNLGHDVLSFIPEETFVAESFGEYPFIVKLAPFSIIARKLQLLALQLLQPQGPVQKKYRPFKKFQSSRFRTKVEKAVVSVAGRNTKNIIQAFGLSVAMVSLSMVAYFAMLIWYGIKDAVFSTEVSDLAFDSLARSSVFVFMVVLASLCFFFYALKAQFGLMFYYRDVYRFRRALLRVTEDHLSVWQRLMLFRLWILKVSNAIMPILSVVLVFLGVALAAVAFVAWIADR